MAWTVAICVAAKCLLHYELVAWLNLDYRVPPDQLLSYRNSAFCGELSAFLICFCEVAPGADFAMCNRAE